MSNTTVSPIGKQVHSFELYPSNQISRSKFDRSHSLITSMNGGYLVPIWYDEAVPGDTVIISASTLTRMATQIVPFMDNVYMDVHFWAVPYRLVWSHWPNFMGEQPAKFDPSQPLSGTEYLTPQLTTTSTSDVTPHSIYDYFGIRSGIAGESFNSFLFRSYNLVWNEFYRDENLQDPVTVRLGDNGVDQLSDFTLLKRGKRKGYLTGALPFPQKGPAVDLPLGTTAPLIGNATIIPVSGEPGSPNGNFAPYFVHQSTGTAYQYLYAGADSNGIKLVGYDGTPTAPGAVEPLFWADPKLVLDKNSVAVDLSSATAATINSLRQAFAVQRVFEKDAIGGTRYIESILAHFGVKSPDARLQRPEFLGGGTFNLNLNVVPQTTSTDSTSPQANLASYGVIRGTTKKIIHSFTEHCLVFALASIRTDLTFQQGLDRNYSRRSRFDYYLPTLANLGEQAVLNKEIYVQGSSVVDSDGNVIDDQVFGYQERWAEMRYKGNRVSGMLKSDANQSLDIWHLALDYNSLPSLNASFIEENPPFSRVTAVTGANIPEFICNFWFDEQWVRPMPVYSIPSMSSHF